MPEWFISMSHVPQFNLMRAFPSARQNFSYFIHACISFRHSFEKNTIPCVQENLRLQCIFRFLRKPNAQMYTHNDKHFCWRHNGNGPSLCVFNWERTSVLQLCWHVSHLCHNVWQHPQYNLTNLLMIHKRTQTFYYALRWSSCSQRINHVDSTEPNPIESNRNEMSKFKMNRGLSHSLIW